MTDKKRDDDNPNENDPLGNLFGMIFGPGNTSGAGPQFGAVNFDPNMLGPILGQMQSLFSGGHSAEATAIQAASGTIPSPDPAVSQESARTVHDAFRLAELWLETVTHPALGVSEPVAQTRKEWVKNSAPGWLELVGPIQQNMSHALSQSMQETLPEEMRGMLAGMTQMMSSMSASLFGAQVGEGLGALSGSVLTGTDYSLPVMGTHQPVIIESNVAGVAAEIGVDTAELRIYLATLELAKLWLFSRTPWLEGYIRTALAKYAAGIHIDSSHIQGLASNLDPNNLTQATEQLREGLFKPVETEEQKQAKATLTRVLSVVSGWADVVAYKACAQLSSLDEIREAMRTRLTTTSQTESALTELLGLDLTPVRLRDAAALFTFLESAAGPEARDAIFSHPNALPTDTDLDDPLGYRERRDNTVAEASSFDDMDEELQKLLAEEHNKGNGSGSTDED